LIRLGEYHRPPGPRTRALAAAFQHAGVPCTIAADLDFAHWEKLVWNIPFNGLGVASAAGFAALADPPAPPPWSSPLETCLMTNQLLDGGWWETLVRALMLEVIAAATALGHPLDPQLADHMIERTRTMGPYKPSTVLDFELGRPLELESLFLEPWRQAQGAGVTTPRLAQLVAVLVELSARPRRT
jgi:2-dehydropantoate 2-reductase